MNIVLAPELESIVEDQVASGQYSTPSEVIRESLLLLSARERFRQSEEKQLRSDIALGLSQADSGKVKAFDAADLLRRIEERLLAAQNQG